MGAMDRRNFLKSTVAAGIAMALPACSRLTSSSPTATRAAGANGDIRIAVAGLNGKGKHHLQMLRAIPGVRVVALCDPDQMVLDAAVAASDALGENLRGYVDIRELLDQSDIDALTIATPNHWHALMAVWAMEAGKDVYVEKPVSHTIWEGQQIIAAQRKYNRVVQAGTQMRSDTAQKAMIEWVQAGNIGQIQYARGLCYKRRENIGKVEGPQPVPEHIDYNLWCGPSTDALPRRKNLHYDWHWFWDYGNGEIGNNGPHEIDLCRWTLGQPKMAPSILSIAGRFGYDDDAETPNTHIAYYDYPVPLIMEVRGLPDATGSTAMDNLRGIRIGTIVQCEGGYFAGRGSGWIYDNDGKKMQFFEGEGAEQHMPNFIQAVRERKPELVNAPITEGHISTGMCHLGNISHLLGKDVTPEEARERIEGKKELVDSYERFLAHIEANGVDLKTAKPVLGAALEFNPETECFIDNPAADALLTQRYREPFVFPSLT